MSPFAVKLLLTVLYEASDEGTPTQRQLEIVNPINYKYPFDEYEFREPYTKGITSIRVTILTMLSAESIFNFSFFSTEKLLFLQRRLRHQSICWKCG
jgi:hypothetical protein